MKVHLTEVGCCDEFCLTIQFIPQGHFLIGNVPQSQFTIEGPAQKIAVVLITNEINQFQNHRRRNPLEIQYPGMKSNGRDEINVLEAAETFFAGDVPQTNRLVHR